MNAPNLPEPWMIAELEKRRIRTTLDERPALELPLPTPPPARRDRAERERGGTVIVIELGGAP